MLSYSSLDGLAVTLLNVCSEAAVGRHKHVAGHMMTIASTTGRCLLKLNDAHVALAAIHLLSGVIHAAKR